MRITGASIIIGDSAIQYADRYIFFFLSGMTTDVFYIVPHVVEGVIVVRAFITLSLTMIPLLLYTFLPLAYLFPLQFQCVETFSAFCQGDSLFPTPQSDPFLGLTCPVCLRGPAANWWLRPWGSSWGRAEDRLYAWLKIQDFVSLGKLPAQPASLRSVIHSSHGSGAGSSRPGTATSSCSREPFDAYSYPRAYIFSYGYIYPYAETISGAESGDIPPVETTSTARAGGTAACHSGHESGSGRTLITAVTQSARP